MYKLTTDTDLFKEFWQIEQDSPSWFKESVNVWGTTWDDYLGFCEQCWRVYNIDGKALLFVEKLGHMANIHISCVRNTKNADIAKELPKIRNEILEEVDTIFGWVHSRSRGLRQLIEGVGFRANGLEMYHGWSHGKLLRWDCFFIGKQD